MSVYVFVCVGVGENIPPSQPYSAMLKLFVVSKPLIVSFVCVCVK